jgi:transcriptional regulator with XRE-family HTH domain
MTEKESPSRRPGVDAPAWEVRGETMSDVVAARVQQLRKRRGWTARQLAEACAATGSPQLTENVIANIEAGRRDKQGRRRRDVTVDELVAFARALDVSVGLLLWSATPQAQPPFGPPGTLLALPSPEEQRDLLQQVEANLVRVRDILAVLDPEGASQPREGGDAAAAQEG